MISMGFRWNSTMQHENEKRKKTYREHPASAAALVPQVTAQAGGVVWARTFVADTPRRTTAKTLANILYYLFDSLKRLNKGRSEKSELGHTQRRRR